KFDFTGKGIAHEAYLSLIESQNIRQCRQKRLREAYNSFRARNEAHFWADRAFESAKRELLVNSAIVAKKSAVMIQEADLQEATSGTQRYPSDLDSNIAHLEALDNSDDSKAEIEAEVTSEIA
ncbi:hypothetical protein BGZ54_003944, partial [Gamsiella multidivaricata]